MNTPYDRISQTVAWAKTQNDRREIGLLRQDLFWAYDQIGELRLLKSDSDLVNDIKTESRSRNQEVAE